MVAAPFGKKQDLTPIRLELETKVAYLSSTVGGREDRVSRRELLSPADGIVNRVLVPTLGAVAAPGKAILEVVPDESSLLMNIRIKPADIGFVRAGQLAQVRVLAYDASTYGKMEATVARVAADAVVDEPGEAYFEVQLSAARDQLQLYGQALPITPGRSVDAGVLTGRRSVMQYLLKPVLRAAAASGATARAPAPGAPGPGPEPRASQSTGGRQRRAGPPAGG